MELFDKALAFIQSTEGMVVLAIGALDMVCRLMKTEKPLDVLRLLAMGLHGVAKVCSMAGQMLDKVLPQKTKELQ